MNTIRTVGDCVHDTRRMMRETRRIVEAACIVVQNVPMDNDSARNLLAEALTVASNALCNESKYNRPL